MVHIRPVFEFDDIYYPQVFLQEFLYNLAEYILQLMFLKVMMLILFKMEGGSKKVDLPVFPL